MNHYEFDSEEYSNEEKILNRKEKKQLEDQKFALYVKYHDILKYGKTGRMPVKENTQDSQSRERKDKSKNLIK